MNMYIAVLLLFSLVTGCRQDESVELDSLYQRWLLVQVQYTNSNQPIDVKTEDWAITEYRSDGTIVYGANGRYTACCSPNRFNRKGAKLDLVNIGSIPIPETDNSNSCATVSCVSPGNAWQILLLTPESLILKTGYGINAYRPYR